MDILYIIKDLIRTKNIQQWINNRYNNPKREIIERDVFLVTVGDTNFHPKYTHLIAETQKEYDHSDIRSTDIVLDVGAHVGGFGLYHATNVKHVYAVEPLFTKELEANINLNGFSNVSLFPYALSNQDIPINFSGQSGLAEGKTLTELKKMAGGHVDFLKCDCEGGEWCIKPEELERIRRIEMEVHSFNGEDMFSFVEMLQKLNYKVVYSERTKKTMLIHAFKK